MEQRRCHCSQKRRMIRVRHRDGWLKKSRTDANLSRFYANPRLSFVTRFLPWSCSENPAKERDRPRRRCACPISAHRVPHCATRCEHLAHRNRSFARGRNPRSSPVTVGTCISQAPDDQAHKASVTSNFLGAFALSAEVFPSASSCNSFVSNSPMRWLESISFVTWLSRSL